MKISTHSIVTGIVFAWLALVLAGCHWSREATEQVLQGELLFVDMHNGTLWIETEDGQQIECHFSRDTQVRGMHAVDGLVQRQGRDLAVQYRRRNGENWAVTIEVDHFDDDPEAAPHHDRGARQSRLM